MPRMTASNPLTPRQRGQQGFTAIELMVVVAILGLLMALAAPSFNPLLEGWRVRQATEQLQSTLYLARSEAIKFGGGVVIQKIANKTNGCTSASGTNDWDCGWIVCHDTDNDGGCDATEPVLQRVDAPSGVQVARGKGGERIKFNRWGLVAGTYLGFNISPLDKGIAHPGARGLCMSSGGRIRIVPSEEIPCTG